MRSWVLALVALLPLAGCAAPSHDAPAPATPSAPSPSRDPAPAPSVPAAVSAPWGDASRVDAAGRLDPANAEATFPLHLPAGASGVRYALNWTCPQENRGPHVLLLTADGQPAGGTGVETMGGSAAPLGGGFVGTTEGRTNAPPGDYLLKVGFDAAYPAPDTYLFTLHAEPVG